MKKSLISLLLIFSLLVGLLFCISSCKKDTGINKTQPQGDCNHFSILWEDYDIERSISGYIIDLYMINDNFAAIKFWTDGSSTKEPSEVSVVVAYLPYISFHHRELYGNKQAKHVSADEILNMLAEKGGYEKVEPYGNGIRVIENGKENIYYSGVLSKYIGRE